MPRMMLTDASWQRLSTLMLQSGRVYDKPSHRLTLEGILYRLRMVCPWRDLPSAFGDWNTVFRRFNLWSKKGVLQALFRDLAEAPDTEWLFLDSSVARAHQHSSGAASHADEAIGQSRGGRTTKLHLAVDSFGLPVHFELPGGNIHDISRAELLLAGAPAMDHVVADKAYNCVACRLPGGTRYSNWGHSLSSLGEATASRVMTTWTGAYTDIGAWLKMPLPGSSIFGLLLRDTTKCSETMPVCLPWTAQSSGCPC